jgi:hypothetical protein
MAADALTGRILSMLADRENFQSQVIQKALGPAIRTVLSLWSLGNL